MNHKGNPLNNPELIGASSATIADYLNRNRDECFDSRLVDQLLKIYGVPSRQLEALERRCGNRQPGYSLSWFNDVADYPLRFWQKPSQRDFADEFRLWTAASSSFERSEAFIGLEDAEASFPNESSGCCFVTRWKGLSRDWVVHSMTGDNWITDEFRFVRKVGDRLIAMQEFRTLIARVRDTRSWTPESFLSEYGIGGQRNVE